jgi:nitroreductase
MTTTYDPKVTPWQIQEKDFPRHGSGSEQLQFLLGYAILAPSSHNTQPWQFRVRKDEIQIWADKRRWLKVADADQRELHLSLGCALENLLVAAEHFGYGHRTTYFPDPNQEELAAVVTFKPEREPSPIRPPGLFEAVPARRTNHQLYDESRPLPDSDRQRLQDLCREAGLYLHLTDDIAIKRQVDELIVEGDARQFADPAWREELGYWIGQGVFGTSWLMSKMGQLAVTYLNMSQKTAKKDSELLLSAPLLGVISAKNDDRPTQVKAGQLFERISLLATALEIQLHPMSQILQFPDLKAEVAALIPEPDVVPLHPFRLGYAEPEKEPTPRRPLAEVLV